MVLFHGIWDLRDRTSLQSECIIGPVQGWLATWDPDALVGQSACKHTGHHLTHCINHATWVLNPTRCTAKQFCLPVYQSPTHSSAQPVQEDECKQGTVLHRKHQTLMKT